MKPLNNYLKELYLRLLYILICILFNFVYIFYNIETFIFFECHFFYTNNLYLNSFIVTEPLQIISTLYWVTFYYTSLFTYPLFLTHLTCFLCNSLYKFQKYYLINFFKSYMLIYFPINILIHLYFIKNLLVFLFKWNIFMESNLISLKVNPVLINLLYLTLEVRASVIMYITLITFVFLFLRDNIKVINLYHNFTSYKEFILFISIITFFFFTSGDVYTVTIVLIINYVFIDIIHLWNCMRINLKFKELINAYIKSNIKKF